MPTEKVREIRKSKKIETEQKFFPGYLLVEMELTDDTWHLVRSTPKVTGFVGSGAKPVALPAEEVEGILKQMEEGAEKPKLKSTFQKGDKVRVIEGPFVNFQGIDRRSQPGAREAQGDGGDLRADDAGGARVLPGGEALIHGEESPGDGKAADPGG